MQSLISAKQLKELGLSDILIQDLSNQIDQLILNNHDAIQAWQAISKQILATYPFEVHLAIYNLLFPNWRAHPENAPAWLPTEADFQNAHLAKWMAELKFKTVKDFHEWTVTHYQNFWQHIIAKLNIAFKEPAKEIVDLSQGIEKPIWFPNAKMNIAESCFLTSPHKTALLFLNHQKELVPMSYGDLNILSNRIANSLIHRGFTARDAIAICMPMNAYAVAIYLGIIKIGAVVVSIADSFSKLEIQTRLKISKAELLFTQDFLLRGEKILPLYSKIADEVRCIVLPAKETIGLTLEANDCSWDDFLVTQNNFTAASVAPMDPCNILFSSGTTAEPKAIIWNHTTAIKAASDAYLHHNVQENDIFTWPTNLGWMMGPWLIFAVLINRGTIGLYTDLPKDRAFGEFISSAKITKLGVVPTLVAHWRQTKCMEGLDWQHIKLFSSTGECSNPEDMLYLMSLAHYKPIIEYCGGTEIGGAYISSTIIQNNIPAYFSTKAMGSNFIILDETGHETTLGEVVLIPPTIGLSTELLNANHHKTYYDNMPKMLDQKILRRHGDLVKQIDNGYFSILGRSDDTMNLGGIKVSAVEIERALIGLVNIVETAAVAINLNQGPSHLVIFVVPNQDLDKTQTIAEMQIRINNINPLFKIYDIVFLQELPKTASNKIMRRKLRADYITDK